MKSSLLEKDEDDEEAEYAEIQRDCLKSRHSMPSQNSQYFPARDRQRPETRNVVVEVQADLNTIAFTVRWNKPLEKFF